MKKILKGKENKAIGQDGVHIELLEVTINTSAKLLVAWWEVVGRTGVLPHEWETGTTCPMYKKAGRATQKTTVQFVCCRIHEKKSTPRSSPSSTNNSTFPDILYNLRYSLILIIGALYMTQIHFETRFGV